ncbi:hypothetical protein TYRP_010829 [Tyrophagus putrescentiae]|nr:hypothetical protein TYRP_010829 [Tyrophagus putrescentiae]
MMACSPYSTASQVYTSSVANSVLKSSIRRHLHPHPHPHHHHQLSQIENENRSLQLRLHNRTLENDKLQQRIEKIESELLSYRKMLESINLPGNGQALSFFSL